MQIVSRKNFLLLLTAILVVALGYMAISLSQRPKAPTSVTEEEMELKQIHQQSNSDELSEIEKDLNATDLDDLDKELQDIEDELNEIIK